MQKIPIRGAYHYYSSGVPWKAQADLFLATTKGKGFHFYCVDYERAYNTLNNRTIAEVAEMVKYIKAQTGLKLKCMVYFSPSIYNESILPYGYDAWNAQQETPLDWHTPITVHKTWDEIRAQRNLLMAASDWTQIPDAVLTFTERQAWQTYRQDLRDIPQNYTNPDDVVFPVQP